MQSSASHEFSIPNAQVPPSHVDQVPSTAPRTRELDSSLAFQPSTSSNAEGREHSEDVEEDGLDWEDEQVEGELNALDQQLPSSQMVRGWFC